MQYCVLPGSVGTLSHVQSLLEKPGMLPMFQTSLATQNRSYNEGLRIRSKFISKPLLATCLNTSEANSTATFNGKVIFIHISWFYISTLFSCCFIIIIFFFCVCKEARLDTYNATTIITYAPFSPLPFFKEFFPFQI